MLPGLSGIYVREIPEKVVIGPEVGIRPHQIRVTHIDGISDVVFCREIPRRKESDGIIRHAVTDFVQRIVVIIDMRTSNTVKGASVMTNGGITSAKKYVGINRHRGIVSNILKHQP